MLTADPETMTVLTEIRDELRALRLATERTGGAALSRADRAALAVLLPAIAASVGSYTFTARELIDHAQAADLELRTAIERTLGPITDGTARRIGKLLKRADGCTLYGFVVVRIGDGRDGALWSIEQV